MADMTGSGRPPATVSARLGKQLTNTNTGETTNPGSFGQFNTDSLGFLLQAAKGDPSAAAMILRLAQGQTGRPLGRFANQWDDLYGKAFQTALSLAGSGADMGTLQNSAEDFLNQGVLGNDLLGYTSGLGQKVAGMDFSGMDTDTMDAMLKAGLYLQGLNMGGLGQAQRKGQLDDIIWADLVRNFQSPGQTKNFADLLSNSPYQRAMSSFGTP